MDDRKDVSTTFMTPLSSRKEKDQSCGLCSIDLSKLGRPVLDDKMITKSSKMSHTPNEIKEMLKMRSDSVEKPHKIVNLHAFKKVYDKQWSKIATSNRLRSANHDTSEERELKKCTFAPKILKTYYTKKDK